MDTRRQLKTINTIEFGLSKRINIAVDNENNYYVVKNIKSRIIMKDGKKISDIAKIIKTKKNKNVLLATTAPVCSKTKKYLKEKDINIVESYVVS